MPFRALKKPCSTHTHTLTHTHTHTLLCAGRTKWFKFHTLDWIWRDNPYVTNWARHIIPFIQENIQTMVLVAQNTVRTRGMKKVIRSVKGINLYFSFKFEPIFKDKALFLSHLCNVYWATILYIRRLTGSNPTETSRPFPTRHKNRIRPFRNPVSDPFENTESWSGSGSELFQMPDMYANPAKVKHALCIFVF